MIRGCLAGVGCLALVAVAGMGAWIFQDDIIAWWEGRDRTPPAAAEVSPELARRTEGRLRDFLAAPEGDSLVLGSAEIESLLLHGSGTTLPAGVAEPRLSLADSGAVVSGVVYLDSLVSGSAAERMRSFFGDSARVEAEVRPGVVRPGVGQVTLQSLRAGKVPVPPVFFPFILRETGLPVTDGLPRSVVFPLAPEVAALYVRDSTLVVRRGPRTPGGSSP